MSDIQTEIMAHRTAELQTALQWHIDSLNLGSIGLDEMLKSLTDSYNEIMKNYQTTLEYARHGG